MSAVVSDHRWRLKEILLVSVLGVAFAPLYMWYTLYVFGPLNALIGPLAMEIVFGFWFAVSILCAYIIRKPGAALFANWIAAVVQLLLGSPAGYWLILTGFIQGLGAEIPFFLTRYRRFSVPVLMLSGVGAACTSFIYNYIRFSFPVNYSGGFILLMFAIRVTSAIVLGALVAKALAEALAATGVLSSFPLGQELRRRRSEADAGTSHRI